MASDCKHEGVAASAKFCGECGAPVNVTQREPGEIRAMLGRIPKLAQEFPPQTQQEAVVRMISSVSTIVALRWALGEFKDDVLVTHLSRASREEAQA